MMIDNDPPIAAWSADDLARALIAETEANRESIDAIASAVAMAPVLDADAPFDAALQLARRVRDVLVPQQVSPETIT